MTKHDEIKALFEATAKRENGQGNGLVFRSEENGGLFRMRVFLAGQLMIRTPFLHPNSIASNWSLELSHRYFDGIETIELFTHAVNVLSDLYNTITNRDDAITPPTLPALGFEQCDRHQWCLWDDGIFVSLDKNEVIISNVASETGIMCNRVLKNIKTLTQLKQLLQLLGVGGDSTE